jgi:hypothetical protein
MLEISAVEFRAAFRIVGTESFAAISHDEGLQKGPCKESARNSRRMNTSEIIGLKVRVESTLAKNRGGGPALNLP